MMVDDLRNHNAAPSDEERGWIEFDPVLFALKVSAVAALGIMIGLYAGLLANPETRSATVVESSR